jgi:hypothetical protein
LADAVSDFALPGRWLRLAHNRRRQRLKTKTNPLPGCDAKHLQKFFAGGKDLNE